MSKFVHPGWTRPPGLLAAGSAVFQMRTEPRARRKLQSAPAGTTRPAAPAPTHRQAHPHRGGRQVCGAVRAGRAGLTAEPLRPGWRQRQRAQGRGSRYSGNFCVDYARIFKASLRGGPPVIPTWREGRPPHVGDTWKVAGVAPRWVRMNPAAASKPHSPPPSFVHQQEPRGPPGTRRGHGGRATHHLGERSSTGRGIY
ncbi:uncharacterized protein LOC121020013 isoform X2 [Herpailurus yagouaroundi]|uniref:uncharacterized protein LOC121020013 isoform X2 n=1 Tax=Herpailurus yagouaroundi TaxID=1608482 RepID=UPI001AD661E7|nr:uncharacterized protein LOC121020013 isoform X2 [Puma yagouaroundi]